MTSEIKTESFESKIKTRIKDSIGDLITDEDFHASNLETVVLTNIPLVFVTSAKNSLVGKKVIDVGKNLKEAGSAAFDFGKNLSSAASDAANKFGGLEKGVLSFDTSVSQTKAINQF